MFVCRRGLLFQLLGDVPMLTSSFLPILGGEECGHTFQARCEPDVEGAQEVQWEWRAAWIPSQPTAFLPPAVLDSGTAISAGIALFKTDLLIVLPTWALFSPAWSWNVPSVTWMSMLLLLRFVQDLTSSLSGASSVFVWMAPLWAWCLISSCPSESSQEVCLNVSSSDEEGVPLLLTQNHGCSRVLCSPNQLCST